MSDSNGVTLASGDAVVWRPSTGELEVGLGATVLAETAENRYVIQLDGWEAGAGVGELGRLGNEANLIEIMKYGPPGDQQDAIEVEGSTLTFMGEMEWGEE